MSFRWKITSDYPCDRKVGHHLNVVSAVPQNSGNKLMNVTDLQDIWSLPSIYKQSLQDLLVVIVAAKVTEFVARILKYCS